VLLLYIKGPRTQKVKNILRGVFRHTDLIGEGEFWIGGLVSFSIIVLVSFAYAFSNAYLQQYPIETSSPSYFACDTTIRNAKFETNVQSLAIPFAEAEQEMADLLNEQIFTLNINLINTLINCDAISIEALYGITWSTIRWLDCNNTSSILKLSIPLPFQQVSVRVTLDSINTIGGLSFGLSGSGHESENYTLKELNFIESFSNNGYLASQILPVAIAVTKIINETKPMVGEQSIFTGIYVPTFTVDMNSLFITIDQYVQSELTLTNLTIDITETPYYVKNLQEPIARQPEIIFRNLLFTVVCLEIFSLVFIFYSLAFKPLYRFLREKCRSNREKTLSNEKLVNGDLLYAVKRTNNDETDNVYITSAF